MLVDDVSDGGACDDGDDGQDVDYDAGDKDCDGAGMVMMTAVM
jgi:hypothetical protein